MLPVMALLGAAWGARLGDTGASVPGVIAACVGVVAVFAGAFTFLVRRRARGPSPGAVNAIALGSAVFVALTLALYALVR